MKTGLALRSTVFEPSLVAKMMPVLDGSNFDSVWFPSVGQSFDALEISGVCLGETRRIRVGTGVITPNENDVVGLLARVHALTEASAGRFLLGVGTGRGMGGAAIEALLRVVSKFRAGYDGECPPIFLAALKRRMLLAAFQHADGAVLNFCSPDYVKEIAREDKPEENFTLSCYIKLFFAEDVAVARKMLVNEIRVYNRIPQYRVMFSEMGVSAEIDSLAADSVPEVLTRISLANPGDDLLGRMVGSFRKAGVDLPIIYPYVAGSDDYKVRVIERLGSLSL